MVSASTPSANEPVKDVILVKWYSDRFSILGENPSEEDDHDNYYVHE